MNWITVGCLSSFLSVALGAFGAHFLKSKITENYLTIFQTAVQYQMFHSPGFNLVGSCNIERTSA